MVAVSLALIVTLLVAGYALGVFLTRGREKALKATLDQQNEKLALAAHELLRRASLDPVTGLPIQQSLQEVLEREWRRAARDHRPVSLIMIEVDHFRAYNDRMGKPEGDICLQSVAEALKKVVQRPADFLARYGAGKFGVVLGGTDGAGAMVLAERLRLVVEELKLPNPVSTTASTVTLTGGVASVTPEKEGAWQDIELIATTERALAEAKEAGRNRVGLAEMPS